MADPRDAPWRPTLVNYEAVAFVLHTDRATAKRWYHAWAWRVQGGYLEKVLLDGLHG